MINYFRKEFAKLFLSVIVIYCIYNSVNLTFFNEKSVTKIFELNENKLIMYGGNVSKVELLRNLNSGLVFDQI